MTHYVGMTGIGGYLPTFCSVYESKKQAVESLESLCELSKRQVRELQKFNFTDLRKDQGNEYAEIMECDCDEPGEHQDDLSIEQFQKECPEFYPEERHE